MVHESKRLWCAAAIFAAALVPGFGWSSVSSCAPLLLLVDLEPRSKPLSVPALCNSVPVAAPLRGKRASPSAAS